MSVCERCWDEASRRHRLYGEGDSVTQVYHRVLATDWCMRKDEHEPVEDLATSGAEQHPEPPPASTEAT